MNKTQIAKFIVISFILAGFIVLFVLNINVPDNLKLRLVCFTGALVGIFMGWIDDKKDKK